MAIETGDADPFGVKAWVNEVAPDLINYMTGYQITDAGPSYGKGHILTVRLTCLVPAGIFGPDNRERRDNG